MTLLGIFIEIKAPPISLHCIVMGLDLDGVIEKKIIVLRLNFLSVHVLHGV